MVKQHTDKTLSEIKFYKSELKTRIIGAASSGFRGTEPGPWFENYNRQSDIIVPSN